jgi:hypothetical protein
MPGNGCAGLAAAGSVRRVIRCSHMGVGWTIVACTRSPFCTPCWPSPRLSVCGCFVSATSQCWSRTPLPHTAFPSRSLRCAPCVIRVRIPPGPADRSRWRLSCSPLRWSSRLADRVERMGLCPHRHARRSSRCSSPSFMIVCQRVRHEPGGGLSASLSDSCCDPTFAIPLVIEPVETTVLLSVPIPLF